jgi:hypothetical protein
MLTGQVSIGKVAARCPAQTEPLVARLRLSRLIEGSDLTPHGLPPQAILLVRRVAVPQRLSLAVNHAGLAWEASAREAVADLYRRAVRPARGEQVSGAEAVLFEDMGELLAWLGVEAQARVVEQRWYWKAVLQGRAVSSTNLLAQPWIEAPRFVPAAVAYLAEWRRITPVFQLFSPAQVSAILSALAVEHSLPQPLRETTGVAPMRTASQSVAETPEAETAALRATERMAATGAEATPSSIPAEDCDATSPAWAATNRAEAATVPSPIWARWLSPAETEWKQLPPLSQHLIGLAITLFRTPAQARSERFATEMAAWLRQAVRRAVAPPGDTTHSQVPSSRRTSPRHAQAPVETDQFVAEASQVVTDAVDETAAEPSPSWAGMEYCETEIGGVLYLLNLFRQTELPECFDEEYRLSEHVSGWGLAELLGRTLLGPSNETYRADPLWELLARLGGREPDETPAAQFQCGDAYRMPAQWLARFVSPAEPWRIVVSPDRLALQPASGDFVIVDRPLNGVTREELAEEEARRYRAQGIEARLQTYVQESSPPAWEAINNLPTLPEPLRRWMRWTFPFLRHLLVWALGAGPVPDEEIARELLLRRGRIYSTATHVDLVMSLNEISLPARRSGLDVNPGWARDLVRVITFHFE